MENIPTQPKTENPTNTTLMNPTSTENDEKIQTESKEQGIKNLNGHKKAYRAVSIKQAESLKTQTEICSFCNKEIECCIINYHMESHPSKILDWLYLGSYNNATNKKELGYINIKYILNCALECKNLFPSDFTYKQLPLSVSIIT